MTATDKITLNVFRFCQTIAKANSHEEKILNFKAEEILPPLLSPPSFKTSVTTLTGIYEKTELNNRDNRHLPYIRQRISPMKALKEALIFHGSPKSNIN